MNVLRRYRTGAVLLAVGGLGFSLIGTGVHAAMTDSGSATATVKTGTLSCAVSTTDPLGVVSTDGKSVTVAEPAITSSAAGSLFLKDMTVTNTGTMPEVVHWTVATTGTLPGEAAGPGPTANLIATDVTLAPAASHLYDGGVSYIGLSWGALSNVDLGMSASATYTATCGEVPQGPTSQIQFIGAAQTTVVAAPSTSVASGSNYVWTWNGNVNQLAWGTGTQGAGVLNVASTSAFTVGPPYVVSVVTTNGVAPYASPATISCTGKTSTSFTGCTTTAGGGMLGTANKVTEVLNSTLTMPVGWQVGDFAVVMTYITNSSTGIGRPSIPASYSSVMSINSPNPVKTTLYSKVLATGDGPIPIGVDASTGTGGVVVEVYRGVSGVGANTGVWVQQANPVSCYPLVQGGYGPLQKTDGTSWVGCLGANSGSVLGGSFPGLTRRGFSTQVYGGDTNGGVAAWTGSTGPTNSGISAVYVFELKSK